MKNSSYYLSVTEPVIRSKCFQLLNNKNISLSKVIEVLDYIPLHVRFKNKMNLIIQKLIRR